MANVIKHKFTSAKTDSTDTTLIRPSNWNDEHAFAGGATGSLLMYNAAETDKASWISAVATKQVLISQGVATAPIWSASPTLSGTLTLEAATAVTLSHASGILDMAGNTAPAIQFSSTDGTIKGITDLIFICDYNNNGSNSFLWKNGAGTTIMSMAETGAFEVNNLGTHSFTAGAVGTNAIRIRNSSDGAGNSASLQVGNDAGVARGTLNMYASSYTTSGINVADGLLLDSSGAGGLNLVAEHGSGILRFYSGGTTQRAQLTTGGSWVLGSGTNITDSAGTPAISSGGGTGGTIAGKDYAFVVTLGTTPGSTVVINLGNTYANAPIVVGNRYTGAGTPNRIELTSSTTQVTINDVDSPFAAGDIIHVMVRGY